MIVNRFLLCVLFTWFFHVVSFAQFKLIKDFNAGTGNSFSGSDKGILYTVGTKLIVKYDSLDKENNTPMVSLTAVDAEGNSQRLAYSYLSNTTEIIFADFKTLPDGKVAFIAIESNTSYKVIVTDGTVAGTSTVYTAASAISGLELIDNGLYFTYDRTSSQALMKIELSTLSVSEVVAFGSLYTISDISKTSNTALIFLATDAADDKLKLFISDGTAIGTTALAVINSGAEVIEKALLTQVGNKVYFFYKIPDVVCCSDLWVTDGSVAGTKKIKEFKILSAEHLIEEEMIFGWKDKLYFAAVEKGVDNDHVLWVSDGTSAGTTLLMPLSEENIHPRRFTVFKNALYFITADGKHYDNKLYKTDGTAGGTSYIDLMYKTHSIKLRDLSADGEYIYITGGSTSAFMGAEVFRYDGVHTKCDFLQGEMVTVGYSPESNSLFVHEGDLYFTAYVKETGTELYTIAGDFTSSGLATDIKSSETNLNVLYPNPAADRVTVKTSQQIQSLRLMNQLGQVLFETTDHTIPLESYAAGVYVVRIHLQNGDVDFQKIIVAK